MTKDEASPRKRLTKMAWWQEIQTENAPAPNAGPHTTGIPPTSQKPMVFPRDSPSRTCTCVLPPPRPMAAARFPGPHSSSGNRSAPVRWRGGACRQSSSVRPQKPSGGWRPPNKTSPALLGTQFHWKAHRLMGRAMCECGRTHAHVSAGGPQQ